MLALNDWAVLVTNASQEMMSLTEAFALRRIRWQIELLFKLWKSHNHIDKWRSEKPLRILCEVYAKLIVTIIQHWISLSSCWKYPDRSLHKAAKTIRRFGAYLAIVLNSDSLADLCKALSIIDNCLSFGCRINKRKKKPNTYQHLMQFRAGS